ncbi:MAG: antibiotic biosynthesis monooxygenase [Erythrobacter sp.]
MAKIVIWARIDLPAEKRDAALKKAKPLIDGALSQDGCLHYSWAGDPEHLGRVHVYEEWASEDALASHFANVHYAGMVAHLGEVGIVAAESRKFRVDAEDQVYGADGLPTEKFG